MKKNKNIILPVRPLLALALFIISSQAIAALTFSSPPRESVQEGKRIYEPVAEYLSRALGQSVVYKHAGSWGIYQAYMQKKKYDIIFDGPHFVAWRMTKLDHAPVAKLPGNLSFVIITRKDKSAPKNVKKLAGHRLCGLAPPNLATLSVNAQFGAYRQPSLYKTNSFKESYEKLIEGKCVAAVLRDVMIKKFDKKNLTRTIFKTRDLPNQAFSISRAIGKNNVKKIRAALLSPDSAEPMKAFLTRYAKGKNLKPIKTKSYKGLEVLLKDFWGFNN